MTTFDVWAVELIFTYMADCKEVTWCGAFGTVNDAEKALHDVMAKDLEAQEPFVLSWVEDKTTNPQQLEKMSEGLGLYAVVKHFSTSDKEFKTWVVYPIFK